MKVRCDYVVSDHLRKFLPTLRYPRRKRPYKIDYLSLTLFERCSKFQAKDMYIAELVRIKRR
jgi:hypothetical protein